MGTASSRTTNLGVTEREISELTLPSEADSCQTTPQMAWAPPVPERQISELTLPSEGSSCQPLRRHCARQFPNEGTPGTILINIIINIICKPKSSPCHLWGVSTSWLTMNFTVRYTKPPQMAGSLEVTAPCEGLTAIPLVYTNAIREQ